MIKDDIEQKLGATLQIVHLDVINESHMHRVPPGSETHFKVIVAAADLTPLKRVARHQLIYKILKDELDAGVHALAIHAYSPEEWRQKETSVRDSPLCQGGEGRSTAVE